MISIKLNIDEKPYTVSMITSPCSLFNELANALSLSLSFSLPLSLSLFLFLLPSHSISLFLFQCSLTRYFSLSRTHSHSHTLSRSSSFSRILSLTLSRPCAFISLLSRIFLSVVFPFSGIVHSFSFTHKRIANTQK